MKATIEMNQTDWTQETKNALLTETGELDFSVIGTVDGKLRVEFSESGTFNSQPEETPDAPERGMSMQLMEESENPIPSTGIQRLMELTEIQISNRVVEIVLVEE